MTWIKTIWQPASEGGGWAAFGDQNKEDNEIQNDNWAAFSEASPTEDKVEDIQENIDTDADDSFGEFGESSTLKSMVRVNFIQHHLLAFVGKNC